MTTDPGSPEYPTAGAAVVAPRAGRRWLALAEVVLCSGVPTQSLLFRFMVITGLQPAADPAALTLLSVSVLLLADTALLIALMIAFMRLHNERPRDLWLGSRSVAREVLHGIAVVPAIFLAVVVLLNALRITAPWLHNIPDNPLEKIAAGSALNAAIFGVVAIVAGGVREELQRAFLLHRFEHHLGGSLVGILVVSIGFGLGHAAQGWDATIVTAALGALWAVMYVRRRSSIAPIVSHAGFNSLEILRVAILGS